jgi:hypothetical protein
MLLHDSLHDAVSDVRVDHTSLAAGARRHGLAIRRRRRALAAVGSVAAVSVLALGASLLTPGGGDGSTSVATEAPATPSGRTEPVTGASAAAALVSAVRDVSPAAYDHLQGDAVDGEVTASLVLQPGGQVFLNLQRLGMAGSAPYTCAGVAVSDCEATALLNGDTLRTYLDEDDEMGAGGERLVAEVISPARRLRIVLSAMNTHPWADGRLTDTPVLTTDQLVEIATLPWWDRRELPVEFTSP